MSTRSRRHVRGGPVIALTALLLLATLASAAFALPTNTNPDAPTRVDALPFSEIVDVSGASTETTYTECGPIDHAVWYLLEPSTTMDVLVDTAGSSHDTLIDVRAVDGGDLVCVDDTAASPQARVAFTVRTGNAYLIAVGRRVSTAEPGEGPAGLVPDDAEELILHLRIEQTRIQRRGAPNRSTSWWRGGSVSASETLIDEPDEYRMHGFVIDAGRSSARVHDDLDLTWRHHRIDHAKQTYVIEHWDAYGSPGIVTVDRRLDAAVARGESWLQGRLCVYPLDDDIGDLRAADLGDEPAADPDGEDDPCSVIGGGWATVDATVVGTGPLVPQRAATMDRGFDSRQLWVEHGISRDGVADLRVHSELRPFEFTQAPATMAYGHIRSSVWHR